MASHGRREGYGVPIKLEIVDVEKVRGLSNYYAYIIKVSCKDGSNYHIYRRYSQFDQMQVSLEKRFLIEAGAIKSSDRVLPNLPAKKLFGRSAIREVTEKRLPILNSYLLSLLALPDKIRYDSIVMAFTRPTSDDLARPYTGTEAYKADAIKPDRPPVPHFKQIRSDKPVRPPPASNVPRMKITDTSKPFRPPSYQHSERVPTKLPPRPSAAPSAAPSATPSAAPSSKDTSAKAIYGYTAQHSDELTFQEGDVLRLLEKVDEGAWWRAMCRGKTGLAPANYLEVVGRLSVVQDWRDQVQDSDEWDSSEDEMDGRGREGGCIMYYYNEAPRSVEVSDDVISRPNYVSVYRAIQKQLRRHDIMLNYKDSDGDLVQIIEQRDMALLSTDATPPLSRHHKTNHAPWAIYVTQSNDNSVYNTAHPR